MPSPATPLPEFSMARCSVVVTGGCQGLGEAIALACVEAGAEGIVVVGLPTEEAKAQDVRRKLSRNVRFGFVGCDLGDAEAAAQVIPRAERLIGPVNCLVNGAAYNPRGSLFDTTPEVFDGIYGVNLRGPFLLTQALARSLKERGAKGAVVNIASIQALGGMPPCMAYSSLKGALLVMTRNNAQELRPNVRVNAVLPGWMPTPAEHKLQLGQGAGEDWLVHADASNPMGRLARPRDVALAVVYLLSPAAAVITGVSLPVFPEMIEGILPPGVGLPPSKL
eukprot:Hpha_TRINITY_DN19783_c0_g1::TRINITY_DN19783_c0_g1_i1::g.21754::m.21754